ncbi:hypothetical protein [Mesorhizobium sp. M4B.F.Ca.ET.019.03.1.1]|uniref:hypothetical protein n=1 Tax=Mesorhizobium sp. M4B.F.Ca.ET.019.03.1.1 TaxID=2496651 RepID=UPI0016783836|nr:hypothetical protein [Mesorhizobium sp. M4B.F.Ca.ET.019.03.1.1]
MTKSARAWGKTMRQRTLNGVLAGAVLGLFGLLAATAYTEIRQADAGLSCASQNSVIGKPPGACEKCLATGCDAGQKPQTIAASRRPAGLTARRFTGS